MTAMLCEITIDAGALRRNYTFFEARIGRERLAPVVKSNAYGHGLNETWQVLAPLNPAWLCVNYLQEARQLRDLGFKGRVLVCGPFTPEQVALAATVDADVFVGTHEALESVLAAKSVVRTHIEFDTGMSRQGFAPASAGEIAARVAGRPEIVAGVCTHFANVEDVLEHNYAALQLKKFDQARMAFVGRGLKPLFHAASSASTLILPESVMDLHRVGISLYGQWPSQATRLSFLNESGDVDGLAPVLEWHAPLTSVIDIEAGQYVGYGCTFRASRKMRIAVIPVGYFEGFPRAASGSSAYVLVNGARCQVVGRVCMNMTMIDVTDVASAKVGARATLIGKDGAESISAAEVAAWADTIHYELLARLNPDIPRKVI
ncbi:alanine racemase [bacterium]|nr:alanine racemase [bacterium]